MNEIARMLGIIFMIFGGSMLVITFFALFCWLMCQAWAAFSNRFRDVCRAESLIHEYRLHKQEFLKWKAERERLYDDGCG